MTERARPFDHAPHGSLAEEASRLAEAAQQWLGQRTAPGDHDVWADAIDGTNGIDEGGPAECRTCPVCRARRLIAGVSPEVLVHLSEAASALGAAVRAMSSSGSGTVGGDGPDA